MSSDSKVKVHQKKVCSKESLQEKHAKFKKLFNGKLQLVADGIQAKQQGGNKKWRDLY